MLRIFVAAGALACAPFYVMASVSTDVQSRPTAASSPGAELGTWISRVLEGNPAVQAARAAVDAAQARVSANTQPLYNPALSLEAESAEVTTAAVGISQTLDWNGKRGAQRDVAAAQLVSAEAELALVRQQATNELLQTLVRFHAARKQRQLALRRSKLMQQFADTTAQRYAAGDVTQLDVTLARLASSQAQVQQAQADRLLVEAETTLRSLTGMGSAAWPELPSDFPPPPSGVDIEAALARLPQVLAHRGRVDIAQAHTRVAERAQRPDPTVTVRGGKEGDSGLLGVSVEIPLFVRRTFRAELEAAGHDRTQAEHLLDEARRRARAHLEGALAVYRTAASAWSNWQAAAQPDIAEQVTLLQRLWDAGELSAPDYLLQVREGLDIQLQEIELAAQVAQAALDWLQASGSLQSWLSTHK